MPRSGLSRNVRLLLAARAARSVGQGTMVVAFALYLRALGYHGAGIGTVLMAGLLFGSLLTLVVGPLSDRRGRRGLLLLYEAASALASLAALLAHQEAVLIAAATIAGFGRGANGAAGPFAPVEQAWLARELEGDARLYAFALNATLGFLGMALGAALAAVPGIAGQTFASAAAYRPLIAIPLVSSLVAVALLALTREAAGTARAAVAPAATAAATAATTGAVAAPDQTLTRVENRRLRRLAGVNLANGLAIGITGPLIAYWFAVRFHQGLELIGPALAASFLIGAAGAWIGGQISLRLGAVRTVVLMRCCGLLTLVAIPLAPGFASAAACYVLRAAFNRGSVGPRQAVAVGLTRVERRGLAASVQSLSMQLPRAVGPVIGGWLIHAHRYTAPFLLAAALQTVYVVLYQRFFGALDPHQASSSV